MKMFIKQKNNYFHFIWILLLAAAIEGCTLRSSNKSDSTATSENDRPVIEFSDTLIDLGNIHQGDTCEFDVSFRNVGAEPIVIDYLDPDCHCTQVTYPDSVFQPGHSYQLHYLFDSSDDMLDVDYQRYTMIRFMSLDSYETTEYEISFKYHIDIH